VVEMMDGLMQGADRDLVKIWQKMNAKRFDNITLKTSGGGTASTHAGDMIGEIAQAIEMGADAVDIGKTIHHRPTLGESIGMAAEIAHGSCTDVPPQKK